MNSTTNLSPVERGTIPGGHRAARARLAFQLRDDGVPWDLILEYLGVRIATNCARHSTPASNRGRSPEGAPTPA